jgi:Cu/Ag efflux pump CusA
MRWIVNGALRARRLMLGIAALVIVAGVARMSDAPFDVLPEFEPPTVEVQTEALGLSAAEVEEFITVPLEQDLLNGVAFLKEIRSASLPGLSSIQMLFEPGTDLLDARQVVQERLSQAQTALPNVQTRPAQMLQPLSSTSRVMMIALSSDTLNPIDLSLLTRWTIGPKLLGVPGVANVAAWGFRDRQLQVLVDPEKLAAGRISLEDIIDTTASAQFVCPLTFEECSTPGTGGIIETPNQRVGVQYVPVTGTPAELASVPVDGAPQGVTLGDVATIAEDHQPLIGDAVGPDLLLVVQKFPAANTLDVTAGLEDALDTLRPGLADVQFDTSIYRPATYIESSSNNLATALIVGGILALIALGLLLFNWRGIVIALVTIASALGAAFLVLSLVDASLNVMTIAGLVTALVVIVDEAVVSVDGSLRSIRDRSGDGIPAGRLVLEATTAMRWPAAYALLIGLIALVPSFFTDNAFGTFFPTIATSYAIAIIAAMLATSLMTPAMTLMLGRSGAVGGASPIERRAAPWVARRLRSLIRTPAVALLVGGVVILGGLASLLTLERSTVPPFKDSNLLVHLSGAPSTALAEMQRVSGRLAEELGRISGVTNVGAHVGRAITSDQVVGTNAGQLWLTVDPDADYGATVAAVEETAGGYPGLRSSVVTYPNARIDELMPAAEAPVVVRLYGQSYDVLQDKGEEVQALLTKVDGIVEPRVIQPALEPTVEIETDLQLAQRYGIRPGEVRRAASAMISGIVVGSLFEEQKVFEVVVWGEPGLRSDLSAVENLLIETPEGDGVRLGDVADVRITPAPTAIHHESVSRYLDVVADVQGRDVGDAVADIKTELSRLELPLEYHAQVQDVDASSGRKLWILIGAAVLLIFLLLQVAVSSWRLAVLCLGALFVAIAGAAIATAIGGGTVSLGTAAGLALVLTIATRQVLALMAACRRHKRPGRPLDDEPVVEATVEQATPVVITLVTTILLSLPIAIAGSIAGLEVLQPMAVAAIGGVVASAIGCLFVVPGLYRRYGDVRHDDAAELSMDGLVVDLTKHETREPIGGRGR